MKNSSKHCTLEVAKAKITLTEFFDGSIVLEKNENGRWFVSTKYDNCFYLQENLEDGEIRDLGFTDNLPDALLKIAWAN